MPQTEKQILKKIFETHKKQLKYIEIPNKKLLICFSRIPGTGKTYISKTIEEKYKGVRINSDDIRKIIKKLGQKNKKLLDEEYKEEILRKYLTQYFTEPPFPNKLILLDSGIDRKYPGVFSTAKLHGFDLFIIRIKSNKRNATKGIIKKLGKPDENFTKNIKIWVKEYKAFRKIVKPDITIKNRINKKLKTKKLFRKLDKILSKS